MDFDAIVIGSGFGGAVASCRLAEAGFKVLVLERGRRWDVKDYPRKPGDAWVWSQENPEQHNGWIDYRIFPNMVVVQGAAVGGGSLIYANISVDAKPDLFAIGWPPEITYQELKPYYSKVAQMLRVAPVPENQLPERTKLVKEAADKTGFGDRFRMLDLAVTFDENWHYGLPDPHNHSHSQKFTNAQGQEQGTCVHLGNCDIGCDVKAKNTLDLTYVPLAEHYGAEVRPLHVVSAIAPEQGGYRIQFESISNKTRKAGSVSSRIVIVAAGSLGSTELLLRCRDQYKTLPKLSQFLGCNWSSNGDFLTPAFHTGRDVFPTRGPTITSAIDFLGDRNLNGEHFFIEDGGFPDIAWDALQAKANEPATGLRGKALLDAIHHFLRQQDPLRSTMPWFAQGRDAADGHLYLQKRWWLFGERVLKLDWDIAKSKRTINAIVQMHEQLARATSGIPFVPPTWTIAKNLVTPHPLGGCNMGTTSQNGVVDHRGEVFGYPGLYVADGSIVPEAIGANPSKTIAALAERISHLIRQERSIGPAS
jgi:cholesterol oxidase